MRCTAHAPCATRSCAPSTQHAGHAGDGGCRACCSPECRPTQRTPVNRMTGTPFSSSVAHPEKQPSWGAHEWKEGMHLACAREKGMHAYACCCGRHMAPPRPHAVQRAPNQADMALAHGCVHHADMAAHAGLMGWCNGGCRMAQALQSPVWQRTVLRSMRAVSCAAACKQRGALGGAPGPGCRAWARWQQAGGANEPGPC
jgi:hypothetical protein